MDNLTHYNMTEEDYIEYCAECARAEARLNLQEPGFIRPFSEILEKRDGDLVFQCLGVIENQQDYTLAQVFAAKKELNRLQAEFDRLVKEMSKKGGNNNGRINQK